MCDLNFGPFREEMIHPIKFEHSCSFLILKENPSAEIEDLKNLLKKYSNDFSDCDLEDDDCRSLIHGMNFVKERYSHCDFEPFEKPRLYKIPKNETSDDFKTHDFVRYLYYCYFNEKYRKEFSRDKEIIGVEHSCDHIIVYLQDHSDEEDCPNVRWKLPIIPEKQTNCGNYIDCGDGTCAKDHVDCKNKYRENKCHAGSFYCFERCVQPCDGRCDCWNCEDEQDCRKDQYGCLRNQFLCRSTMKCLPKIFIEEDKACLALELRAKKYGKLTNTDRTVTISLSFLISNYLFLCGTLCYFK